MLKYMQNQLREIGTHQTTLLKQHMTIKRSSVSTSIAALVGERYKTGEGLRTYMSKIVARGADPPSTKQNSAV